jgi:nitrate/nitrite-specific signal transduction histidine kinase
MNPPARRGSLQQKIITWSFIPTVLILLAVALVNFQAYIKVSEDLVLQRNRELAYLKAAQLASEVEEMRKSLEQVAVLLGRLGVQSFNGALALRQDELQHNFDQGILVLDNMGRVLAASPRDLPAAEQDWNREPLYNQIRPRQGLRSTVTDIMYFMPEEKYVVGVAVPVTDGQGRFVAVLVGLVSLKQESVLYESILNLRLESRGEAILVDGVGKVIYHHRQGMIGADLSSSSIVQQVIAGKVGTLRTKDDQGQNVVSSYAPVIGTRWGLITQEDWSLGLGSSRAYIGFLIGLLLLGIAVPTIVVTLGVRRITRPIAELTLAAQEVAGGRFGRTIHSPTNDELEELAGQFNSMSRQLQESYAVLEQRVEERTRQLASLNRISAVVSRSLDLTEILESALETTGAALRMEAGAVYLLKGGWLVLNVEHGFSDELIRQVERLPEGTGAAGEAVRCGCPVVRALDDYPPGELRAAIENEGLVLVVSVPLLARGSTLGAMNLCTRRPRTLNQEEIDMLAAVGGQVGIAVENARLYREAEQAAAAAERSRLARDLHDAVTQTLFSASLIAEVLPRLWQRDPQSALERVEELRQLNRGALAEMRSLLLELRPAALLDANLNELFRHLADAFTGRTRLPVHFTIEGDASLPGEVRVALYRIAQEALNNIARHAAANQVHLELVCREEAVCLTIRDDGRGFDPGAVPADHMGVRIMAERAAASGAKLTLRSQPGQGTEITAEWTRRPVSVDTGEGTNADNQERAHE